MDDATSGTGPHLRPAVRDESFAQHRNVGKRTKAERFSRATKPSSVQAFHRPLQAFEPPSIHMHEPHSQLLVVFSLTILCRCRSISSACTMRQHSSLDWILPLLPTYRDLLHYKNVLYDVERAKTRLSVEDAVHKHYPDSTHPPPVLPPFRFTWSHINSLLPRVSKRVEVLVAEGEVDAACPSEEQRETAWQSLRQQPSRRASRVRERARQQPPLPPPPPPPPSPQQQQQRQDDEEKKAMGEEQKRREGDVKEEARTLERELMSQSQQAEQQLHPHAHQQPQPQPQTPPPCPLQAEPQPDEEQQRKAEQLLEVQEQLRVLQQHNTDISHQLAECRDQLAQSRRQQEDCRQRLKQQSDLADTLQKKAMELTAEWEQRLSASKEALKLTLLQGYIIRACHEFTLRCPKHDHPLLNENKLKQVTLDEAYAVLSCVRTFSTFSTLPDHQQLFVDAGSDQAHLKKVFRGLSLMVHPDKLPDDVIQDNRGGYHSHIHTDQIHCESIGRDVCLLSDVCHDCFLRFSVSLLIRSCVSRHQDLLRACGRERGSGEIFEDIAAVLL